MQIIKDREIIEDQWQHIADDDIPDQGRITVALPRWQAEKDSLIERDGELGIRLTSEDGVKAIADDLQHFQLVALEFPAMTDGRGFSYARLLRSRYNFTGEIRAIGNFTRDQIYFLQRVGVNAFELKDDDLSGALASLDDFSVTYQSSTFPA